MPKVPISTRVEEEIAKRLDRIAAVDRRTVANIVEICVEEYLHFPQQIHIFDPIEQLEHAAF